MGPSEKDIDLKRIEFPSDKLTAKDLRRLYPKEMDTRHHSLVLPGDEDSPYSRLSELVSCERLFAICTFEELLERYIANGLYEEDRDALRDELAQMYVKFGLASGPNHAEQLVRKVEQQALRQAEAIGKGR